MLKRTIIFLSIILIGGSGYAYFYSYEQNHPGLSPEMIRKKWERANPEKLIIRSGDLIFRHSHGVISHALMLFSRKESKYSHAGIISIENKKIYVYHAIGGEENPTNKLRKDPLEVFCNPENVYSFGIYRLDLDVTLLQRMDSMATRYFRDGLEFDTKFDLGTDDKMYCSEFVYKLVTKASGDKNYLSLSTVQGMSYVACDDLYANSHCTELYFYRY